MEASAQELYAQIDAANAPPQLRQPLRQAVDAIQAALRLYGPERLLLSFNGGKDATVLLHVARAVYAHAGLGPPRCVYWDDAACFPQVATFVEDAVQRYGLPLVRYSCGFTDGLRDAVDRLGMAAVLLGTRTCDPNGVGADAFQPSSAGWPTFMRVNPLLHWAYHDVWRFLRGFKLPFCELYERGYTSLGNMHNTRPNPALALPSGAHLPADALPSGVCRGLCPAERAPAERRVHAAHPLSAACVLQLRWSAVAADRRAHRQRLRCSLPASWWPARARSWAAARMRSPSAQRASLTATGPTCPRSTARTAACW